MKRIVLPCIALSLTALALTARADVPAQADRPSYNLFNPVPDATLRAWHTDFAARSHYTTDAGHLEAYLSDGYSYSQAKTTSTKSPPTGLPANSVAFYPSSITFTDTSKSWSLGSLTLKYGLLDNLDLEAAYRLYNASWRTTKGVINSVSVYNPGNVSPLPNAPQIPDSAAGHISSHVWGNTPLDLRLKYNVWGNDGGLL